MIPIKDSVSCNTQPLVCWSIMAICISLFLIMQLLPPPTQYYILQVYGMLPIRYFDVAGAARHGLPFDYGLSFLTSLFLHGGWFHLILNMWFIWIFADKIEDRMGHGKFLGFYLLCGLIATLTQWSFNPKLMTPVVGASGAIAAVLGAYFFLYPYSRIKIWIPLLFLPIFMEVPAIAFLGFWVIVQINEATSAVMFDQVADVAWWAHLGGFGAGAFLHSFFLSDNVESELPD